MWMMDVDMNCSQTNQGWFLLTALVTNYNGSGIKWYHSTFFKGMMC